MNALDLFIFVTIVAFTGLGFYHGLIRSLSSLIATVGGLILAKKYSSQVTHFLSVIQVADIKGVLGFILVLIFFFLVIKIALGLLQKVIRTSVIASVDKAFGGMAGFIKGGLLTLLVIALLQVVMPRNSAILVNSKLLPYSSKAVVLIKGFVPEHMHPYIQKGVYTVVKTSAKDPAK